MLQESDEGVILRVRVVPGAKQNQVAGVSGNHLRLRIMAPPVEGKANRELIKYLAGAFGLKKNRVVISQGEGSREKTLLLTGLSVSEASKKLKKILPEE